MIKEELRNKRIGETRKSNENLTMTIIEYRNAKDMDVLFENGYIAKHVQYDKFKHGKVRNLIYPTVYGVGFVGVGNHNAFYNGKHTLAYNKWISMLSRIYDETYLKKYPTYTECSVCESWHNFQNFAEWFDNNYYVVENEIMTLDKDLLSNKNNKIYSPNTCCFLPQNINNLLVKSDGIRGKYPLGVSYDKDRKKYTSHVTKKNKRVFLGRYNTPEEAFYVYKREKEKYVKEVADQYKDTIPSHVYNALYAYEVEITD